MKPTISRQSRVPSKDNNPSTPSSESWGSPEIITPEQKMQRLREWMGKKDLEDEKRRKREMRLRMKIEEQRQYLETLMPVKEAALKRWYERKDRQERTSKVRQCEKEIEELQARENYKLKRKEQFEKFIKVWLVEKERQEMKKKSQLKANQMKYDLDLRKKKERGDKAFNDWLTKSNKRLKCRFSRFRRN